MLTHHVNLLMRAAQHITIRHQLVSVLKPCHFTRAGHSHTPGRPASHVANAPCARVIIITRVSGQVHCAYNRKSTLVQDKQDTTRRPVT